MIKLKVPQGYRTALSVYDTQRAIEFIKDTFPRHLGCALNLKRVSAPLFVGAETGLNDNLNGVERPVSFDVPAAGGAELQVVHSLAKWKRLALKRYEFYPGNGLYTDMNAIRRDEEVLDNLHSVYVDQWDWEKIMLPGERNADYLKDTVRRIVAAICNTNEELTWAFPSLHTRLCREVTFVTAQQLEDEYPELTPSQRELEYARRYQTIFVMQIGKTLRSGKKHDGRAPDYDDWELNGDIIFYNSVLDCAFEVSSMGIRVDAAAIQPVVKSRLLLRAVLLFTAGRCPPAGTFPGWPRPKRRPGPRRCGRSP